MRKHAWLAVPGQRLPHPFDAARDFPAEGLVIDTEDPVWMQLLRDGSLTLDDPNAALPAAKPRKNP